MSHLTQKEKVARYLAENIGRWVYSYDLHKVETKWGYLGIDADTRAYDLVRDGFETEHATYVFEKTKEGRYAKFRCAARLPKERVNFIQGVGRLTTV